MRIAVLSGGGGWHVLDLVRAARQLGHAAEVVDFRTVSTGVAAGPGTLAGFDAVLVRTMPAGSLEQVVFRMDALHTAAAAGARVLNPPRAVEACVDKYLTTARLAAAGLPTPDTHVSQTIEAALDGFDRLGGDVVVKPLFGSEGRGMVRLTDPETAWRTFHALARTGQVVYQQRFVRHPGWDLRAFVIGGRVLAGMRRTACGDWRTNVAQGGTAEAVELDSASSALAVRAADAVGCLVAGVDLLPGPDGALTVIEVNAVPGWRALAAVTGRDVAADVVRYLTGDFKA